MAEVAIGPFRIGSNHPPFIVAELSANHHGSLARALQLATLAKEAGAHAFKLQTYRAETITLDSQEEAFIIQEKGSLWHGRRLYDLYKEGALPWEWHKSIMERCRELGLVCFSTPFDESAVDFLEELNIPCYKIASPEIVDLPLIRKVAATGKPLMLSTGAATLAEVALAIDTARRGGCSDLILMHCRAAYPAPCEEVDLRTIPHLGQSFNALVGFSDHTLGIGAALASVALGACVIEKHFTLSRKDEGLDDAFSLEPHELTLLVNESLRAWYALGTVSYGMHPSERVTHGHRPSLFFIADLPAGTAVQAGHVASLRPAGGLPPRELDNIVGLTLHQQAHRGMPVTWSIFQQSRVPS